ncbi:MAG: hypothetical protein DMG49_14395, partial [Acidobacteria bacterium]
METKFSHAACALTNGDARLDGLVLGLFWCCQGKFIHPAAAPANVQHLRDDQSGRGWQWSHGDLERGRRGDDGYQRVGQLHLLWFGKRDI